MGSRFFSQPNCDRCHKPLTGGRIMSRFNEDCLCMDCAEAEKNRPDYQAACDAELAAVKAGNYNFPGIGFKEDVNA